MHHAPNPNKGPHDAFANDPIVTKVLENTKLQEINLQRQNSNFPKLYISDFLEFGGALVIAFKDQSYCSVINMASNEFFPRQISINPIVNESILSMKGVALADKEVMVVGFNYLNQLAAKRMYRSLLNQIKRLVEENLRY